MPFGYVPLLEVDGRKLSSSGGIARFLAERFGKTLPIVVLLKVGSISPRMHKVQWALKLICSPACLIDDVSLQTIPLYLPSLKILFLAGMHHSIQILHLLFFIDTCVVASLQIVCIQKTLALATQILVFVHPHNHHIR